MAYYTDCISRRLNTVCKYVAQSKALHGSLSIVNYIGVLFIKSGKFRDLYRSIDQPNDKTRFKLICPTRWTVRCKVISAVLNNYLDIINALEQLTMTRGNSTELIVKANSYKNTPRNQSRCKNGMQIAHLQRCKYGCFVSK